MSRGYFGVAVYHPKHEVNVGTLWRSASTYGAAFIGTVGCRYERQASDTTKASRHIPLVHYATVDDLVEHLPNACPLVAVEFNMGSEPLTSFRHPDRALYLLGAEDHGLPQSVVDRCHFLVHIPTPAPWSLNVAVAGSLVMHDRFIKGEQAAIAAGPTASLRSVS